MRAQLSSCAMLCEHCGSQYAPRLPAPLYTVAGMMQAFERAHAGCPPQGNLRYRFSWRPWESVPDLPPTYGHAQWELPR